MRPPLNFGPWSRLDEAANNMPEEPGVFQLRRELGLIAYPKGKSAMLGYGAAPGSLRAAVGALAASLTVDAHEAYLCRCALSATPEEPLQRLLSGFIDRFGAPPRDQAKIPRGADQRDAP